MRFHMVAIVTIALTLTSATTLSKGIHDQQSKGIVSTKGLESRSGVSLLQHDIRSSSVTGPPSTSEPITIVYDDSVRIFKRKRNAHACMMSIVFIVLYPLAALSLHLPLKIRVVQFIHAPIQTIGLVMMIGAMGLGINITRDLHYWSPVRAHVVIGLIVTCSIILVQPAMGILQHLHFRKTGGKSSYAYIHRWVGRVMIALGWINNGLGFQLTGIGAIVHASSLIRNFVLMGVLASLWFFLVVFDEMRGRWKRSKQPDGREKDRIVEGKDGTAGGGLPALPTEH